MKVKLISKTDFNLDTMYVAAKTCYSKEVPDTVDLIMPDEEKEKLVNKVLSSGHQSIAEHVNFTFKIEGITRACSHQLVRHRHATFSQQSQRYVDMKNIGVVEPETILKNREADAIFNEVIDKIQEAYKKLLDLDIKKEDARSILPNCTKTNIIMTLNLRELIHICSLRLCTRAQKEIRELVQLMVDEVNKNTFYQFKDYLKPSCGQFGYCPEENGCGKKKKLKELLND